MSNSPPKDSTSPWRRLPPEVAGVLEPAMPGLSDEILSAIAAEVPEYARPIEGSFGRGIRTGVGEALRQFVALIAEPETGREQGREIYLALGRGEMRQGRSLDSLQAAYRVGARVAWRRVSHVGLEAGLDSSTLCLLAEAIFAYIDELAAESVEGYAQAQSAAAGERDAGRRRLLSLLASGAEEADIRHAARDAGFLIPNRVAALACEVGLLPRLARRLPATALTGELDGHGCAVVADPGGPGMSDQLTRAVGEGRAALGPEVPWLEFPGSWTRALLTAEALAAGTIEGHGLVRSDDHLMDLVLHGGGHLLDRLAETRLAPLDPLTPKARARTIETLFAYLVHRGSVSRMAEALHLHPQTIRYRMARLREVFGSALDQPDARFELEAVLRRAPVASSSNCMTEA